MHVLAHTEADTPARTHGLSDRIARIKREVRLLKGVWLTDDQAFAELDRIDSEAPELVRRDLTKVTALMTSLSYDPERIREAVDHVRIVGTTECCVAIDVEDRKAVEDLLDDSPEWNRPGYSQWPTWEWEGDGQPRSYDGSAGYAGLAVRGKRAGDGVFRDQD